MRPLVLQDIMLHLLTDFASIQGTPVTTNVAVCKGDACTSDPVGYGKKKFEFMLFHFQS